MVLTRKSATVKPRPNLRSSKMDVGVCARSRCRDRASCEAPRSRLGCPLVEALVLVVQRRRATQRPPRGEFVRLASWPWRWPTIPPLAQPPPLLRAGSLARLTWTPKNLRRPLEHSGDRFVEPTVRCPSTVPPPKTAPPRLRAIARAFFRDPRSGASGNFEGRASVGLMARLGQAPWPTGWPQLLTVGSSTASLSLLTKRTSPSGRRRLTLAPKGRALPGGCQYRGLAW
jgi:hypothetical protein